MRLVIKFGTSVLTAGTKTLDAPRMVDLARQCAALHHAGHEVVLCSSGAIAAGRARLGFPDLSETVGSKQMLAAVGQSRLMRTWEQFFDIYGVDVGQILLTHGDVESRPRFLNAQDTFRALLAHRVIPIVNENDAVATEEIKIGDNDNLSALVALLVGAELLVILTDQAGLYTADPRRDPDAVLIQEVAQIDDALRALAGGRGTALGTGGMVTKLQAAALACRAGTEVVIADGGEPDVLRRIVAGERVGTRFRATGTRLENRKRWILAGVVNSGGILVDAGAAEALRRGGSLLPAGIVRVEGTFARGDTVPIRRVGGGEVARGIARYNAADLRRIAGHRLDEVERLLGYTYGTAVHRNDMILMGEGMG